MLQEKFGNTAEGFIDIQLSGQGVASLAGTTYETVFRIMNELVLEEIVTVANKDITVINKEKLQKLTDDVI